MGHLRFSNGSDMCGRMSHDVSCGSNWYTGVGSVMAESSVAQVYMVQLWFRVGVTSMWFRGVAALSFSLALVQLVFA